MSEVRVLIKHRESNRPNRTSNLLLTLSVFSMLMLANTRQPYYHTIYDTSEKIDQAVLAQATKVSLLGLWLRANA